MGVIIAKVFKKEREPIAPEFIAPTQAQQRIIKETWEVPKKNLTDSGELILFKFLDMFPKNQEKFPAFNNVPLLSVRGTPGFRTHAERIMSVLQGAVDALDTDDVIKNLHDNFTVMAMNHARRDTPRKAFFEMRGVLIEVLTEACNLTEEQQEAWFVFYNCAISIIFGKFDEYDASLQEKPAGHAVLY